MKRHFFVLTIGLGACLFNTVDANEIAQCAPVGETPDSRRDYIQCLDRQLELLRRDLTAWQNKRQLQLENFAKQSGITQPWDIYLRSQQSFDSYLEDSCRWRYLRVMPDAAAAAMAYKHCELRLIEQRIDSYRVPLD